jgi:hypothetical protein
MGGGLMHKNLRSLEDADQAPQPARPPRLGAPRPEGRTPATQFIVKKITLTKING